MADEMENDDLLKRAGEEYVLRFMETGEMHTFSEGFNEKMGKLIPRSVQQGRKHIHFGKRFVITLGSAAAAVAAFFTVCAVNPAWAATLPVIGSLFRSTQTEVDYKGDYAENAYPAADPDGTMSATALSGETSSQAGIVAETLTSTCTAKVVENVSGSVNDEKVPAVEKADDEITMTIPELTCTKNTVYLGVTLTSRNGFPDYFMQKENDPGHSWTYDYLNSAARIYAEIPVADSSGKGSLQETELSGGDLEGHYTDSRHFTGMYRLELDGISSVPDAFTVKYTLTDFWGAEMENTGAGQRQQTYSGSWAFTIPVRINPEKEQVVTLNDSNQAGYGISTVTRNPYEISADMILPEGRKARDVTLIICDAHGDLLETQGSSSTIYQAYERDTDHVYIFICDATDYGDNLINYFYADDYAQRKVTMSFAQYLKLHALYSTEVSFE